MRKAINLYIGLINTSKIDEFISRLNDSFITAKLIPFLPTLPITYTRKDVSVESNSR